MTRADRSPLLWQPRELIDKVARQNLDAFLEHFDASPLLVVRLDPFSNDLELGLAAIDAANPKAKRHDRGTITFSANLVETLKARAAAGATAPANTKPIESPTSSFPARDLLDAACYVVRLGKRTGPRSAALSIGRAATHDVVLQHGSVSTLHAFLELEPQLVLRDAGSRNGTSVNGQEVTGPTPVRSGDRIKFGAVQCALCTPAALWHVVQSSARIG